MGDIVPTMSEGWVDLFRAAIFDESSRPLVLALATVDREGHPQVRSVICRKLDESGAIWMTSDSRSAKIAEISACPSAAASCWLSAARRQFRFRGSVEFCSEESERRQLWLEIKPETRASFFWPAPGLPKSSESAFIATSDAEMPPQTFAVLLLRPASVELLELNALPHRRRQWRASNHWQVQELNP